MQFLIKFFRITSLAILNNTKHLVSFPPAYMKVTQTGSCLTTFFDILAMVLLGIYAANVFSQASKKTILQFAIFIALGLSGRNLTKTVQRNKVS